MRLHGYFDAWVVRFQVSVALFAWQKLAIVFFVLFNLTERVNCSAQRASFADNFCHVENFLKFGPRADLLKLTWLLLLAVATALARVIFKPVIQTRLTIYSILAHGAENWLLCLRHDQFFTDDAVGITGQLKIFHLRPISDALTEWQRWHRRLICSHTQTEQICT